MAKKKKAKPQREITKRQLSKWQQQRRRQRIIFGLGVFIIVAVLAVVGVGWYINQYQPLQQTVISVNDTKFNMDYYVNTLKFYGKDQSITFMYGVAGEVETIIERNEMIRQGTMKLGISVSDEEVDKELKSHDPPFNDVHRDIVWSQMLVRKLQDEYFEQQVPVYTEQRHVMAMLLESERQANEVRLRLEGGESFAALAEELSLESFTKEENGDLGWHPKEVLTMLLGDSTVEDYAFASGIGVVSQPIYDEEITKGVGYWIAKVLERKESMERARVLGILLGSEEEAQRVRERLEAGEDFDELAEELSQDEGSKEDGGALGWFDPGEASPAFDEFVFDYELELGVVSEPIFDDTIAPEEGYWLIKVSERKEKEAHVQAILLASEEEAQNVITRLEAGEDFAALVEELSQLEWLKENGGDLGFLSRGIMTSVFDEFVFDSEVELGVVSEPIFDDTIVTKGGYWLVKVVDKDDNRRIEDSDRDLLKAEALNEWLEALWDDPETKVENYLDDEKRAWAIEKATKELELN